MHASIARYPDAFGRQVFNLDFAMASLAEDPLPFLINLKALVRDPGPDPEARRRKLTRQRRRRAFSDFKGGLRMVFLRQYMTARVNYPSREEALFFMGHAWSTLRPFALELGASICGTWSPRRS